MGKNIMVLFYYIILFLQDTEFANYCINKSWIIWMIVLWAQLRRVWYLTSDSELSSSASVGALSSLFLWLRGSTPPWLGPAVPLARDWVLTANFLGASGVSAGERYDFDYEQCTVLRGNHKLVTCLLILTAGHHAAFCVNYWRLCGII